MKIVDTVFPWIDRRNRFWSSFFVTKEEKKKDFQPLSIIGRLFASLLYPKEVLQNVYGHNFHPYRVDFADRISARSHNSSFVCHVTFFFSLMRFYVRTAHLILRSLKISAALILSLDLVVVVAVVGAGRYRENLRAYA